MLAHMMTVLNERHGYGLDLFLLSIDEGISGYRDDSLETVKRNEAQCAPLEGQSELWHMCCSCTCSQTHRQTVGGDVALKLLTYGHVWGLDLGTTVRHGPVQRALSPQVSCMPCYIYKAGCEGVKTPSLCAGMASR